MAILRSARTLTAPPVMGAFTGVRAGLAWLEIWSQTAPELTRLGMEFWDPNSDPGDVAKAYEKEFMASYEDSVEASLEQLAEGQKFVAAYLTPPEDRGVAPRSVRRGHARRRSLASAAPAAARGAARH